MKKEDKRDLEFREEMEAEERRIEEEAYNEGVRAYRLSKEQGDEKTRQEVKTMKKINTNMMIECEIPPPPPLPEASIDRRGARRDIGLEAMDVLKQQRTCDTRHRLHLKLLAVLRSIKLFASIVSNRLLNVREDDRKHVVDVFVKRLLAHNSAKMQLAFLRCCKEGNLDKVTKLLDEYPHLLLASDHVSSSCF